MSLNIPRVLLALGAVGAVYLFFSDDEPVAPKEVKNQQHVTKPAITRSPEPRQYLPRDGQYYSQTPAVPPTYSYGSGQRSGVGQHWDSQFPESHFRPPDQTGNETGGSQPETRQPQPNNPAYPYGPPGYDYPDYRYQNRQSSPNTRLERFRPLDEKRQSKRWQGNYQRLSTWPEQLVAPNRSASYLRLAGQD